MKRGMKTAMSKAWHSRSQRLGYLYTIWRSWVDNIHQVFGCSGLTDLKPATLKYIYKTEKLSGKIYYKVKNEFGIMLSYSFFL